jgi:hypothetical protein
VNSVAFQLGGHLSKLKPRVLRALPPLKVGFDFDERSSSDGAVRRSSVIGNSSEAGGAGSEGVESSTISFNFWPPSYGGEGGSDATFSGSSAGGGIRGRIGGGLLGVGVHF